MTTNVTFMKLLTFNLELHWAHFSNPGAWSHGTTGGDCPWVLLAAASKAPSQLLSPEPMLTGRQEVWKASLKLQEKFGKISCNYPNDSCTNHTTAPQIPCLQAEPKPTYGFKETCRGPHSGGGRAKRLQGLCFCWEGGGVLPQSPLQLCPIQTRHFLWNFFHLSVIFLPSPSLPLSCSHSQSQRH